MKRNKKKIIKKYKQKLKAIDHKKNPLYSIDFSNFIIIRVEFMFIGHEYWIKIWEKKKTINDIWDDEFM